MSLPFMTALEIAQRGFDIWAAKPHNIKWARRLDGTPIVNDLVVCIAQEMTKPIPPLQKADPDPRGPDYSRTGIFIYHNCSYCDSGKKPCKQGSPHKCDYPHARDD